MILEEMGLVFISSNSGRTVPEAETVAKTSPVSTAAVEKLPERIAGRISCLKEKTIITNTRTPIAIRIKSFFLRFFFTLSDNSLST